MSATNTNLEEIGREIKRRAPGKYDQYDNATVGRAAVQRSQQDNPEIQWNTEDNKLGTPAFHGPADSLPIILSTLGAIAGGSIAGPPGAVAGGALGGVSGEGYRQSIRSLQGHPLTREESGREIKKQAAFGGFSEIGGQAVGLALKPAAGLAKGLYQASLKPSAKALERGVVETGLKEGIAISQKGQAQVQNLIKRLNQEIDSLIQKSGKADEKINTKLIVDRLDQVKEFFGETVLGHDLVDQIEKVGNGFMTNHGKEVSIAKAQRLKQNTNILLRKMYGQLSTATNEASKALVRGLKEEIQNRVPEVAALNPREGSLIEFEKALAAAMRREFNKNPISLTTILGGIGGGTAYGGPGAVYGAILAKILNSPSVSSRAAILLNRAAKFSGQPLRHTAATAGNALLNLIFPPVSQQNNESNQQDFNNHNVIP